uniref:Zgc:110410 n=1 Tax=Stegastes partitus TaxID=144197 RepID=A0A3B4Z0R0_9TELE
MVHPVGPTAPAAGYDQQYSDAPPSYSDDPPDSVFSDGAIRRGFIRKVYLTLLIQLVFTIGIICAFLYWLFICYLRYTLYSLRFEAEAVLWAVGATALVSFSLSVFAMQSKWDFTTASGSLWVFGWTLLSFALLCAILRSQVNQGPTLFTHLFYLVFDTQLILGGKHRKYEVSPEEYIFAALNLYLDIVSLFLLLLQLIGLCR